MSSGKKVVSGVIWTTILNIVNAIYSFIAVPILINYFGKAEYGLIGLAMSINVYLRLMDMGLGGTNVRFFARWLANGETDNVRKGFQTSLTFYGSIGLINAAILLLISCFSTSIFHVTPEQDIILKHLLYILSFSAFVGWYSSCFDQLIKGTENVAWVQRRSLIPKALMITVLFITVYGKLSIEWYYTLTVLASISILPLSIGKIHKMLPYISFVPRFNKSLFMEMLPYSLNIFSFSIFQFSFHHLRPIFLGIQGTVESVADFKILNGLVGIVTLAGGAFLNSLIPSSSKVVAAGNKKAFDQIVYQGTKYISVVVCFCCFGMMCVGPELLTLYVGESYLYLLPWLNLWLICTLSTHNQAISSLILAGTDIRAISYSSAISSTIGLVASWFLIPSYGVGGTIIAFGIYLCIQLGFYYFIYWPFHMQINSWRVFWRCLCPYMLIGVILSTFLLHLSISTNEWISVLSKGTIFTIFYIVLTWLTFSHEDKNFIQGIINKKKK